MLFVRYVKTPPVVYRNASLSEENLSSAIDRGILFLEKQQNPDGGFSLYICDNAEPERCDPIDSGPNTAAVFLALWPLRGEERVDRMAQKGIAYIVGAVEANVRSPGFSHAVWNVFSPDDIRHGRIPSDIDGLSVASLALKKFGVSFSDDETVLLQFRNSGGLFYNWLSHEWNRSETDRHAFAGGDPNQFPDPNYYGVDCVVNADVLAYFSAKGKQPEEICSYLNDVIERELYPQCTFYYRSPYILFTSMIAAAVDEGASCLEPSLPKIKRTLLEGVREDGTWSQNFFSNVVATFTLVKLEERGAIVSSAVEHILKMQRGDGGWDNAVVFPDLYNPVFYGSREIVTATALRTLFEYKEYVLEGKER